MLDQEALVINVDNDKSITLKLQTLHFSIYSNFICRPDGRIFFVDAENYQLPQAPREGDIVTFSPDYLFRRVNGSFISKIHRIRSDLSWEDVLAEHANGNMQFQNGIQNFSYSNLISFYRFVSKDSVGSEVTRHLETNATKRQAESLGDPRKKHEL